jgi:ATP-dependent helicase/nuclease subunit B
VELEPHRVREGLRGFVVPAEDVLALWNFLSNVRDSLGGPEATWSQRAQQARALIAAHLGFPSQASLSEADARRAIGKALDELEVFDRLGTQCTWEEFLDQFEAKLSNATRELDGGGTGVRALDVMEARGHRFKATILIGLKDNQFPRRISEDPLLTDTARSALRHPAGYWIGRKAAGHEEERLLFALTVASARERLSLIYPRSDEDGRVEVPSAYLRELCRASGLSSPGENDSWRVPRPPADRLRALEAIDRTPAEVALLCACEGGDPPAILEQAQVPATFLKEGFKMAEALNERGQAGVYDGLISPPVAAMSAWKRAGLSPTALDEYAQCPFKFFASRILGFGSEPRVLERGELASAARGQIYHAVLERFYRTLPEPVWSGRADESAHLERVLDEIFAENDWHELGVYPLLWEAARASMSRHLHEFIRWDIRRLRQENFRPRLFEARLHGEPQGGPPGGILWRGIADRIDADLTGKNFRVSDYKTRKSGQWRPGLARLIGEGKSHQIPFYTELTGHTLGEGWVFHGGELLFIEAQEDNDRSTTLSREEWEGVRGPFLKSVAEKMKGIHSGLFPIRPQEGERGHCSWCDFSALCRKSHAPARARAMTVDAR